MAYSAQWHTSFVTSNSTLLMKACLEFFDSKPADLVPGTDLKHGRRLLVMRDFILKNECWRCSTKFHFLSAS